MRSASGFLLLFVALAGVVLLGAFFSASLHYGVVAVMLVLSAIIAWVLSGIRSRELAMQRRFSIYFERARVGMAVSSPEKRWLVVNPALCEILGYPAEALLGKTWAELTHPDDLASNSVAFERVLRGEVDDYELEKRFIRADAQVINTRISVQVVRKSDGSVDSLLVVIEDITARRAAEKALRASEERLRHLGDNLPDSYIYQCAKSPDGLLRFLYVSSGVRLVHGFAPEELIQDPNLLGRYVDPGQLAELQAAEAESGRTLQDFSMELRVRLANNEWGWMLVRSRPRQLASGEVVWDGVASNITARRQAAAMLDLQARRASVLLELPHQSARMGEQEFMQYALGLIEEMTGSKIAFMHFVNDDGEGIELVAWSASTLDKYCTAAFDNHYPLTQAGLWADAVRQKQAVVINDYALAENRHGLPPGHSRLDRLISLPVLQDGRVRMVTGVGNKQQPYTETDVESTQLISNEAWRIVDQRRAERALKIATQVVNASPVVCFRWHAAIGWPVVFVSDNVAQWGYSVAGLLAGSPAFGAIIHPDDCSRVLGEVARHAGAGRAVCDQEYRILTAAGQVLWVSTHTNLLRNAAGAVEFYDGVLTDITEHKRQEQELASNLSDQRTLNKRLEEAHNQLLQSEKMASIGQLAAGIAHELNNPIGFVHSNLGTLEGYVRDVMEIIDSYDRAAAEIGDDRAQFAAIERLKEERDFGFLRQDIMQLMAESREGLGRVRKIVQDLKSFSHVSEQDWQWADLHQGLDSTLNIVWNELKYKCTVVKEYGSLPKVYCLISQLNQVFMNLLVNAGHAIEKQGTITLRTSCVDKHHGRIEVESDLGVGTTFRVILPIQPETGDSAGHNTEIPT